MSEIAFLKYFTCCFDEDKPIEETIAPDSPKKTRMSSLTPEVVADQLPAATALTVIQAVSEPVVPKPEVIEPVVTEPAVIKPVTSPSIEISNVPEPDSQTNDNEQRVPLPTNAMDEIDTDGEDGTVSPRSTIVPSNTPVTGDSGQGSPNMQSSTDSLSDDATLKSDNVDPKAADVLSNAASLSETVIKDSETESGEVDTESARNEAMSVQSGVPAENKNKGVKDGRKEEKKEEKKKSKKKEDKSIDYILRALNSLHSPEEKLAALCKKYADLHEEHRVLQTSFKTQQRTISVVMREKDQLQSEHTKAMMAKSKLESLCRELQKHNKIIKDESIKRAKEDDEKRKEISAQFNHTIGEIQTQMSDNSERNAKLRQENENLAAQLRSFIKQCEVRDLQVEKLHEQHELEKKLAEAKMNQAQAIIKEHEEKAIKERELLLLKLAESGKKSQILEAQVNMFKERYDEFEKLHTRSSETFQKYKTEMDKMTKRIKKLEKDGLQWKTKWESSNKALIEQIEARSKSEKESLIHIQKTKKLESLCRALQAELHGKKVVDPAENKIDVQDSSSSSTVKNNDSSTVVEQSSNHESSPAASSSPPPPASPSPVASSSSSESPCMPNGTAPTPATADTTCPQPPPSEESLPQTASVSSTSSVSTPDLSGSEPANNRVQSADEGDSLPEIDQAASLA